MLAKIDWNNEMEVSKEIKRAKQKIAGLMKKDFGQVWQEIEASVKKNAQEIQEEAKEGKVIPEIDFNEIKDFQAGQAKLATIKGEIKRKGVIIVRNVIPREKIDAWYLELKKYLKDNDYENQEVDPNLDTYFSKLKSHKPQIFNIFWSKCQVNIRQHENLAQTKHFINQLWNSGNSDQLFFHPDKETAYADRIRIRDAGDNTLGLSPHIDGGSVERWMDDANLKIYEKIFSGEWQDYKPFEGAYRNEVENIASPAVCRAFRTYQGWMALTTQGSNDGTLQLIPMLKNATAYLLLRPFLNDVPEDVFCGANPMKAQDINPTYHQPLLDGLVTIPLLYPGDTVWWHCDLTHAVEDEHKGKNESSVTYIGSAPLCQRNQNFIDLQKDYFLSGKSSPDFAAEDREVNYKNRATIDDLTDLGKKQMGITPWD